MRAAIAALKGKRYAQQALIQNLGWNEQGSCLSLRAEHHTARLSRCTIMIKPKNLDLHYTQLFS